MNGTWETICYCCVQSCKGDALVGRHVRNSIDNDCIHSNGITLVSNNQSPIVRNDIQLFISQMKLVREV